MLYIGRTLVGHSDLAQKLPKSCPKATQKLLKSYSSYSKATQKLLKLLKLFKDARKCKKTFFCMFL